MPTDEGSHLPVLASWAAPRDRDFGFLHFEPGDLFTKHYRRDRWYTVKELRDGRGTLKDRHCDITRPAVLRDRETVPTELTAEDLAPALRVSADDSRILRLDENEPTASDLPTRAPAAPRRPPSRADQGPGTTSIRPTSNPVRAAHPPRTTQYS
ncbi:DUF402 domain-containing protein [Streptomyces catenulae]|uniref:DUF402 domain-containing protein n=1 Tax=Streptomyces catenulae TaxID=66875 RepID=A0ABV2YYU6_9ACTN|nr:DUF402 domain-containing protein [Streptomyces catenulae]